MVILWSCHLLWKSEKLPAVTLQRIILWTSEKAHIEIQIIPTTKEKNESNWDKII